MDLELTDNQSRVRDMVRRFAREKLDRAGVETDRTHQFPAAIVKELSELGIMGIFVPETYGGAGMDHVCYALAIEEISVQCAATGGDRLGPFIARHVADSGPRHRGAKAPLSTRDGGGQADRMLRLDRAAGGLRRGRAKDQGRARRAIPT